MWGNGAGGGGDTGTGCLDAQLASEAARALVESVKFQVASLTAP